MKEVLTQNFRIAFARFLPIALFPIVTAFSIADNIHDAFGLMLIM